MLSLVLFAYLSCLVGASSEAFGKDADELSWLDSTTLGLQRTFTVTKKPFDTSQKNGLVGSKNGKNQDQFVDDEAIALGLEIDDAAPNWLADATTLGLQRGFKVTKKPANPSTNVQGTPGQSLKATTTLGLQRGFKLQKKANTHPEATQQEQFAKPLENDFSVLGLQRGFHVTKTFLTDPEVSDELPSSSLQESSVLGLQRGFHVEKGPPLESPTSSLLTSTLDFQHSIEQQKATKLALTAANLTALVV